MSKLKLKKKTQKYFKMIVMNLFSLFFLVSCILQLVQLYFDGMDIFHINFVVK